MSELRLERVRKRYGDALAVDDVSFAAPDGAFVVLVGPSGCGKSTLLRAIAGLEDIDGGDIRLGGRSVAGLAPRRRNMAMVFQNYALYPYLTVFENIAFGLRARGAPSAEIDRRVRWAAELLGVQDHLTRHPRELSGGQRQRVAIGRAIVRDADLYLFDEPLSNLDAQLRDGMREELKRLHARLGKTFVYVTHDQIEAMTLADRIVLLRSGRIEQEGAPLDLFERPTSRFVAEFLGSPRINLIPATVEADSGRLRLADGQRVALGAAASAVADGPVAWGVRPEHFRLARPDEAALAARVDIVQPTGSRLFATVALAGAPVTVELNAHCGVGAGAEIRIVPDMARSVLFDQEGARLHVPTLAPAASRG
jgi:ABC-type sugar transport system ATPase subunit